MVFWCWKNVIHILILEAAKSGIAKYSLGLLREQMDWLGKSGSYE
jgi:hypothetical protein